MSTVTYTAIVEPTGTGFSAYVPDVPGCIATGADYEETVQQMQEALACHLEWMREDGDDIPEPTSIAAEVQVPAVPTGSPCWDQAIPSSVEAQALVGTD